MGTLKLPVKQSQAPNELSQVQPSQLQSEAVAIPPGLISSEELKAAEKQAYERGLEDGQNAANRKVAAEREEIDALTKVLKKKILMLEESANAIADLVNEFNMGAQVINSGVEEISSQLENKLARDFLFDEELLAQQMARKVERFSKELMLVDYRIIADSGLRESFEMDESLAHHLAKIQVEKGACKLVLIDSNGELYWDPGMIRDALMESPVPDSKCP
ncbi:hypothetical protein JF535_14970 [Microbulbifer salipaludis]|uniref:Flagellar assembly protein FliH/Type III secretion system HrpE domain-containing protein n=1 Tax=Microbulbifer salipaludis TaxID=187980 RepID=A0ABS3EA28_9GAMM|nr:hypothetical protein [Microbulbifer salipaludis]MBN8432152.1 hypothetical protein [Microbulbifer salipaludis]